MECGITGLTKPECSCKACLTEQIATHAPELLEGQKFWVYGWWCDTLDAAKAKADAIGKAVKATADGVPLDDQVLYVPGANGAKYAGTYA